MKNKIILLMILFIMSLGYSQTIVHDSKVQINMTDPSGGADEVLALDSSGLITNTGISVSSLAGGITITGIPVANQLTVWASPTSIEGEPDITYNGTTLINAGQTQLNDLVTVNAVLDLNGNGATSVLIDDAAYLNQTNAEINITGNNSLINKKFADDHYGQQTLVYNIPVNGVTSTSLTWIGEQRSVVTGQVASYLTDFAVNNQHIALIINSITGSGNVTITGVSASESTGVPVAADTEVIAINSAKPYQSSKKWLEVTNIDIPVGITAINYDIEVLGYLDLLNSNFSVEGFKVYATSSGVNSDVSLKILKVQDDGAGLMALITIEHIGIDGALNQIVDEKRIAGNDRSYNAVTNLWASGTNTSLKQYDYSSFFVSDENIIEGATKNEGIIIVLEGTNGGNINNVDMFNLHLMIKYID